MNGEAWIKPALDELENEHLKRELTTYSQAGGKVSLNQRPALNFSSNDYLDLARHPDVSQASQQAVESYGTGSGASRLVSGSLPLHDQLEKRIAEHKGYDSALFFGCGFLTSVGVIPALVGRKDTVFADSLVHASIIDAVILSRARLVRFRHNDSGHLRELLSQRKSSSGRCLIVTESIFSMDGDCAPLPEIAELAREHDVMLMVDEAHATGVFGPGGSGLVSKHGLQDQVNISMGTFSKALGNYGGTVACTSAMKEWLVNRVRAFIYTTAPPPAVVGGCLGALDVLEKEPSLAELLQRRVEKFRAELQDRGFDTGNSCSQIIPVLAGDSERALEFAQRLRDRGLLTVAIRPPTVPKNTARLRLSVTLAHSEEDLTWAADQLTSAAKELNLL